MAVYTTQQIIQRLDEAGCITLANGLIDYHGSPAACAAWASKHFPQHYTARQVANWRQRGVPASIRPAAMAAVLYRAFPGDTKLIRRIVDALTD